MLELGWRCEYFQTLLQLAVLLLELADGLLVLLLSVNQFVVHFLDGSLGHSGLIGKFAKLLREYAIDVGQRNHSLAAPVSIDCPCSRVLDDLGVRLQMTQLLDWHLNLLVAERGARASVAMPVEEG